MKKRRTLNRNRDHRGRDNDSLVTRRENVRVFRGVSGQRAKGEDEVRRVYTRAGGEREQGKGIRVRKNESIRADAEGPSTTDKRDS